MRLSTNLIDKLCDVNLKIEEILLSHNHMEDIMKYVTIQKGKQLRPILCLTSAEFGNRRSEDTVLLSAIIEIIHMASLIHDDIIDNANVRRGTQSVQKKYGVSMAVYAGDYMLANAFNACSQISNLNQYKLLFHYLKKLLDGEINQHFGAYNLEITEEEYLSNIRGKTACLFELACVGGAKTGDASKKIINALKLYGQNLGMLFQIRDDLLNFVVQTDPDKPSMNDFKNGIYTLPVIYALKEKPIEIQKLKESILQNGFCENDRKQLIALIDSSSAMKQCEIKVMEYFNAAMSALEMLPANYAKEILADILTQIHSDILAHTH